MTGEMDPAESLALWNKDLLCTRLVTREFVGA